MKTILLNTFKITVASFISIMIARYFKLEFYLSAGILTILTIQHTKKETIQTALERFVAFILALIISYLCFTVIEFSIVGFIVYLVIYIFICQYFKWYSSMAINSVLITHFLTFNSYSFDYINNEIGLFVIGVGIGVVSNLHLNQNDSIHILKKEADEQIKYILFRMSLRILNEIEGYNGQCFIKLNHLIIKAKALSLENEKNTFFSKSNDYQYIKMREHQSQVLQEMYKVINRLNTTPITSKIISDLILKISIEYNEKNDCILLLKEFYLIHLKLKEERLPITRKEFEDRARLFHLMQLIEEFLTIKKEYIKE